MSLMRGKNYDSNRRQHIVAFGEQCLSQFNLRRRMEDAHDSAPLSNTAQSVRALENGFREMCRLHCARENI